MIELKRFASLIIGLIMICSCKHDNYSVKDIVISDCLYKKLLETVNHIDSSYNNIKSILINFDKRGKNRGINGL